MRGLEFGSDWNNLRQNHPELVAQDLFEICGVPHAVTRLVLKARGVAKWLAVRRMLITLKHRWKDRIHRTHLEKRAAKEAGEFKRYHQLVGYERALVECRQQVRALCHHTRNIDWPTDPRVWAPLSILPVVMPLRPNKRWVAHFFGEVAA